MAEVKLCIKQIRVTEAKSWPYRTLGALQNTESLTLSATFPWQLKNCSSCPLENGSQSWLHIGITQKALKMPQLQKV